jgi:methylmalonyl-CoA carboxyltransferase large subunit
MKPSELRTLLAELQAQLAALGERVSRLETAAPVVERPADAQVPAPAAQRDVPPQPEPDGEIPEEILLAISAAVAAFLGERAHVRQVRLIRSAAWAQQGRVSVQASHRLRP